MTDHCSLLFNKSLESEDWVCVCGAALSSGSGSVQLLARQDSHVLEIGPHSSTSHFPSREIEGVHDSQRRRHPIHRLLKVNLYRTALQILLPCVAVKAVME